MAPDPDGTAGFPWGSVLLLAVLILLNGFFSAAEIAVVTLNNGKIKKMADGGNQKAQVLVKMSNHSKHFFSTMQVCITLSGFLSSAVASQSFAARLANAMHGIGLSLHARQGIACVILTILMSCFSLVLGQLVPRQLAVRNAESIAFRFADFLNGLFVFFLPLVKFLTASTKGILRMFGVRAEQEDAETITEEEIRMVVNEGEERGVIEENEKDMISNVLDFDDSPVSEMMTHRTEIAAVEDTDTLLDVVQLSAQKGFSRIPVYHEDLDNILGFIYVKDLLRFIGQTDIENVKLTDLMRPAAFVPETQSCSRLYQEMIQQHRQIAVAVDEYGGTEGLITLEDLLESIVGNIQDEYDHEEEKVVKEGPNRWSVEGSLLIEDVEELTGVTLPKGDYDTLAGLMVERLGRIPSEGEYPTVVCLPLTLKALRIQDRRIERILIQKQPEDQKEKAKKLVEAEAQT